MFTLIIPLLILAMKRSNEKDWEQNPQPLFCVKSSILSVLLRQIKSLSFKVTVFLVEKSLFISRQQRNAV